MEPSRAGPEAVHTTVVLFTRDLRVHDNPALYAACRSAEHVVPLFVVDPRLAARNGRQRFLAESLTDLRASLRRLGGDLLVRHGDPVAEVVRAARRSGATAVAVAADASGYAARRSRRLADACAANRLRFEVHPGVTVVPPGELRPSGGGDHYRVFTPYWRAWLAHPWRCVLPAPGRVPLPPGLRGDDPARLLRPAPAGASDRPAGGESAGRRRLATVAHRDDDASRDDLAADATSRLSPYLHFGCVSPREAASVSDGRETFLRQLCWRDFYLQVLAAFPELPVAAYRPGAVDRWRDDAGALADWQSGHTGVPIVDAGMRQLAAEGWLHNRARLITAAYLTKTLGLDWRAGADWYARMLVDADVALNGGNWQWVAGTGTDARPRRRFDPIRQARRFDPDGAYVRRWVNELAHIDGAAVHEPWGAARPLAYPRPLALTACGPNL